MNVIHGTTKITTQLMIVDDDGNVIHSQTGENTIQILKIEEFERVFNELMQWREQYKIQASAGELLTKQVEGENDNGNKSNRSSKRNRS